MKNIKSSDEYKTAIFPDINTCEKSLTDVLIKKLEIIHDIRKFEIELYWKRATYYWTFLITVFSAYGLSYKIDDIEILYKIRSMVICIGFTISYGWLLVNRGSKFWQENWEKHLAFFENYIIGNLYKMTLENTNIFLKLWESYPFSVSKINIFINIAIIIVWVILYIIHFDKSQIFISCISIVAVIFFLVFMTMLSKTSFNDSKISFKLNEPTIDK